MEMKGALVNDRGATEARMHRSLKSFCDSWHHRDDGREVIFDKSRGWAHNLLALRKIYPESKVILTVRDLRNVFSSIEKQHRKNPLLDSVQSSNEKTIYGRADNMFAPKGLIGGPIEGVKDVIRRKTPAMMIKYEQLVAFPAQVVQEIYQYLGEDPFEHDFKDVKSTATDVDGLYNHKFPHKGSGEVKPTDINEWTNYYTQELANIIMNRFPMYNNFFGYK
jgi:sulfotransferase